MVDLSIAETHIRIEATDGFSKMLSTDAYEISVSDWQTPSDFRGEQIANFRLDGSPHNELAIDKKQNSVAGIFEVP